MTRRITLIRHGETEANVSGGWQGQSNSPLTDRGLAQIELAGRRFEAPSLLVCSDLDRTVATAEAIGTAEADPMWREYDFGAWDGLHPTEIERRFPGQLTAMRSGEDFAPGDDPDNYILPEDVARTAAVVLAARPGTVFDEINLSPQKRVIEFGEKKG